MHTMIGRKSDRRLRGITHGNLPGPRAWFLVLALLVAGCSPGVSRPQPGADGIGDTYAPQLGNGGYDVQAYDLDLAWDDVANVLSGSATIKATASIDLSAFNLDFYGFSIEEITVNGEPSAFSRDGQELTVTPHDTLRTDQSFTVAIDYAGTPEIRLDRVGSVPSGWMTTGSTVAVPPFSNAGWFPANDHPRDKARFTIRVTVAKPLDVVASGRLIETIDNGSTTTFVWRTQGVAFMPTVAVDDFEVQTDQGPDGLPIEIYFRTGSAEGQEAAGLTGVLDEIMAFFGERFGPYPFEVYHLVLQEEMSQVAYSLHTTSVIRREVVADSVLAHELAHQWFANSVSPYGLEDMWLVEGFATYAEALWVEHTTGEDMLATHYDLIRTMGPPGAPPLENVYDHSVYGRGAWTLKTLHGELGDDTFFDLVRAYTDRYRDSVASTADFIALAEEISGEDLDEFFDEWLYGETMPSVPGLGSGG